MPTICARKLRALMIRRGISVRELAQAAGLSKTTVSEILQGDGSRHFYTAHKLAKFFGVEPSELLNEED